MPAQRHNQSRWHKRMNICISYKKLKILAHRRSSHAHILTHIISIIVTVKYGKYHPSAAYTLDTSFLIHSFTYFTDYEILDYCFPHEVYGLVQSFVLSLKHQWHARVYISPTSHCAYPGSIAQGLFTDHILYAKPQGHECTDT